MASLRKTPPSTLPDAVRLVKERVKTKLSGLSLVLYFDGGISHHADGRKVMCVCGSSMGLISGLLLDLVVRSTATRTRKS